jgi:hypothetical protein
MKEVKLVRFTDLTRSEYWSQDSGPDEKHSQYEKRRQEEAEIERPKVEQSLAGFLNDGWHIEGTGGDSLRSGFVVLVRERED